MRYVSDGLYNLGGVSSFSGEYAVGYLTGLPATRMTGGYDRMRCISVHCH